MQTTYKDALKDEFGLEYPCSDYGNMQRFNRDWGGLIKHIPETRQWIKFGHDDKERPMGWEVVRDEVLNLCADETINSILIEAHNIKGNGEGKKRLLHWAIESGKGNHRAKMLEYVSEDFNNVVHIEEFDKALHETSCQNGILNLKTLKLRDFTPKDLSLKRVAVAYNPEAKCPLWIETLAQIFPLDGEPAGDMETIDYLQRALGYAATGEMKEEKVFFCSGRGINGKGTVFETVMHVFGDYAAFTDFGMILSKENDNSIVLGARAGLVGKRFAWADESQSNKWLNEAAMKQSTNPIQRGKLLYKDVFPFPAQYKLFLTTNHLPKIKAHDKGTWRRVSAFQFRQDFEKRKDDNLKDALKAEAEGVFAWIVRGAQVWYEKRLGALPKAVQKAIDDYRDSNDFLGPFWNTWMVYDDTRAKKEGTYSIDIYHKYVGYQLENGLDPVPHADFGTYVYERGIEGKGKKNGKAFYFGWFFRDKPLEDVPTEEDLKPDVDGGPNIEEYILQEIPDDWNTSRFHRN